MKFKSLGSIFCFIFIVKIILLDLMGKDFLYVYVGSMNFIFELF